MNPDQWRRVGEIFEQALALDPTERSAYLDRACAGDAELRAEIQSLIDQAGEEDDFFEAPPPGAEAVARSRAKVELSPPPDVAAAMCDPERRLGRYVLLRELGTGGFGTVWLAWDGELGRQVAVKLLHRGADLARFRREARIVASLAHPNIAAVYEVGEEPPFIAMPFIDGATAGDLRPPAREAVRIVRDAALAIAHAHERGVVHRDLKPQNLMLDGAGRVFVMDFGMARAAAPEPLTVTGMVIGTPAWMAPEQAQASARVDARADVYGLGATLYTLLTGRAPFDAIELVTLLRQVVEDEPPPLRSLEPALDRDLEIIVQKAMAKEPARRYPSAQALAIDLERWLAGEPIDARASSLTYRTWRRARRHPWTAALAAALVILVACTLGFWLSRPAILRLAGIPVGATIRIDGSEILGAEHELAAGAHVVEVQHADFEPWRQELVLARGQSRDLRVDARRRHGTIVIESATPGAGADLLHAEEPRVRHGAPTEAQIPTGHYRVHAFARDHWSRWSDLTIEAEQVHRLELPLARALAFRRELGNTPIRPLMIAGAYGERIVTGLHEGKLLAFDPRSGDIVARWSYERSYIGEPVLGRFLDRDREDLAISTPEGFAFLRLSNLTPIAQLRLGLGAKLSRGVHELAAGDLDGDGRDELVFVVPGEAELMAVSSERLLWVLATEQGPRDPVLVDLDGDRRAELALRNGSSVEVRDGATGERLHGPHPAASGNLAIGHFNADCLPDLAFLDDGSALVAVAGRAGSLLWRTSIGIPDGTVTAADDRVLVQGVTTPQLVALDARSGSRRWQVASGGSDLLPHPALIDSDGDGQREIAIYSQEDRELVGRNLDDGSPRWGVVTEPFLWMRATAEVRPRVLLATATALIGLEPRRALLADEQVQGVRASIVAADLDGDGRPEAIVAARRGRVRGYSQARGVVFDAFGSVSAVTPAFADLDGDGGIDLVTGSWDAGRSVSAFRGRDSSLLWQTSLGAGLEGEVAVGDLDGDGRPEVVVGTWDRRQVVAALDGASGAIRWQSASRAEHARGMVLADLDGDQRPEVVAAGRDGQLRALDGRTGTLRWERSLAGTVRSQPTWDGRRLHVAAGDRLIAIAADGVPLWTASLRATRTTPLIADGRLIAVDGQGSLIRFEPKTGRVVDRFELGAAAGRAVVAGDADRDGELEIYAALVTGRIVVYSPRRREILWEADAHGKIEGAPAVADFNGDGRLDVAVGSTDGFMIVFAG